MKRDKRTEGYEGITLYWPVVEGCFTRVTFQQVPELHEEGSCAHTPGKSIAGGGNSRHGGSEVGLCWFILGAVRRPGWIKQLVEGREHPQDTGTKRAGFRLCRALKGVERTLSFSSVLLFCAVS